MGTARRGVPSMTIHRRCRWHWHSHRRNATRTKSFVGRHIDRAARHGSCQSGVPCYTPDLSQASLPSAASRRTNRATCSVGRFNRVKTRSTGTRTCAGTALVDLCAEARSGIAGLRRAAASSSRGEPLEAANFMGEDAIRCDVDEETRCRPSERSGVRPTVSRRGPPQSASNDAQRQDRLYPVALLASLRRATVATIICSCRARIVRRTGGACSGRLPVSGRRIGMQATSAPTLSRTVDGRRMARGRLRR